MTGGPEGARAESVWLRSYPFWDAYFAMVLVGTIAATAADGAPPGRRAAAILLLVLLSLAYVAIGRKALRSQEVPRPGCKIYAVALICMFVPATLLAPVTATGLSALAPQVYMMYGTARGLALMLVLLSGPVGLALAESGASRAMTVVIVAGGVACSVLLAVFIGRLGRQNRERLRLIEELDRTRGELAEVSREAGVLAERERLARDIHDTIAQGFTSIVMLLQAAEADTGPNRHLELAVRTARENLAETRGLVAALAPPALDGGSLVEALRRMAGDFDLPADLVVEGEPRPLDAVEVVLLRVAQEALANVRKHSGAGSVMIMLEYGGTVRLTVADDGRGFDPERAGRGFGLRGMRSRVEQAGGTFTVNGADGTRVEAEVPCSAS
ncbi:MULTISPECIES: sensor histidine kinase [Actinomadura]|uniref:Histidine kinase-, DNA gyrase B-, and HSP90-like ATPase n=1 Tax=Actinomadura madurae TaxID=1993 RepID=A0A1I4WS79_9ACTN|nr:sensor histidine kinase [Actinomadura madurae]SFN16122.1 Histidine kinase-, DNA gyrase B-, and HSP90-like ATPase [Actinomadura madurae]